MRIAISERINRLKKWFYHENDRLLLGFDLDSQYPLKRYKESTKHLKNGAILPQDIIVKDFFDDYNRLFILNEEAGGDHIWSAAPFWGIPWVEAALGCEVVADFTAGSISTRPPNGFSKYPKIPEFSINNPWVSKLLEFIPALEKLSAGRYPVGVTLMRGVSDLLAALYGGENFIFRMYEAPEEVKKVVEKITDFWIVFGKIIISNLRLFSGGTGAWFYRMWCPGKTIWLQEDAAALLSPKLYEEFIHPSVCRIAKAFEHTAIHLHPAKFLPVDYILESYIDVIELHIDKGGPTASQLYETYMKIIREKPLFIYGNISMKDLNFIIKKLPHKGLAINITVSSQHEAKTIWERVME